MKHIINFSCVTHIGRCRSMNQDNFICNGKYMESQNSSMEFPISGRVTARVPSVFGVFDGMGGEECGEIASLIAARKAGSITVGRDAEADMLKFCNEANAEICAYAAENGIFAMGTTAAMLAFTDGMIVLCNIGDSKVFRLSGGQLEQLSVDHVAFAAFGRKPPLSQNLGIPPEEMLIDPYTAKLKYKADDIYLICSDGLTDMVAQPDIARLLAETPYDEAANRLLGLALENGGKDNITIILCRIERNAQSVFGRLFKSRKSQKEERSHDE